MAKLIVTWCPLLEAGKNEVTSRFDTIWEARKARAAKLNINVVEVMGRWINPPEKKAERQFAVD